MLWRWVLDRGWGAGALGAVRLADTFTALLSPAEKRRNRFVSATEREIIEACERRRAHREAERKLRT